MDRSVTITVKTDSADAALLEETIDWSLWAAQYVTTSKTTLNDGTYDDVREDTNLHSNHVDQPATVLPRRPNRCQTLETSKEGFETTVQESAPRVSVVEGHFPR